MKKIGIVFLAIFIIFSGVFLHINNNSISDDEHVKKRSGYTLQVKKENCDLSTFTCRLTKTGNFTCDVQFTNNSDKKSKFALILYLNYEQIYFKAFNEDINNIYEFELNKGESIKIPVSFEDTEIKYKNNSLICNVVAGINKHASDINKVTDFYGMGTEYNLMLEDSKRELKDDFNYNLESKSIESNNNFIGIFINQDFKNINDLYLPNSTIYAKPGEEVELAIRYGGYSNTDTYIIWFNLGKEQCVINNEQKYILTKNDKSKLSYQKVKIKVPEEKGKYDLWAMIENNPLNFQNNLSKSAHFLRYSHRVTIVVE